MESLGTRQALVDLFALLAFVPAQDQMGGQFDTHTKSPLKRDLMFVGFEPVLSAGTSAVGAVNHPFVVLWRLIFISIIAGFRIVIA